jgi:hypothetical protein
MKKTRCTPIYSRMEEGPDKAITRLFEDENIDQLRRQLWEWLKTTVAGTYNTKLLDRESRYDLIYLYEKMDRLLQASYCLHAGREKQNRSRKKKKRRSGKNQPVKKGR